jgi:hypothetical protein
MKPPKDPEPSQLAGLFQGMALTEELSGDATSLVGAVEQLQRRIVVRIRSNPKLLIGRFLFPLNRLRDRNR